MIKTITVISVVTPHSNYTVGFFTSLRAAHKYINSREEYAEYLSEGLTNYDRFCRAFSNERHNRQEIRLDKKDGPDYMLYIDENAEVYNLRNLDEAP